MENGMQESVNGGTRYWSGVVKGRERGNEGGRHVKYEKERTGSGGMEGVGGMEWKS